MDLIHLSADADKRITRIYFDTLEPPALRPTERWEVEISGHPNLIIEKATPRSYPTVRFGGQSDPITLTDGSLSDDNDELAAIIRALQEAHALRKT